LSAVCAVFYDTPTPTAYALLEIFFWESNKPFLHTIVLNFRELCSTVLVGFLAVYLLLLLGLYSMSNQVDLSSCSTIFQCVIFRLHLAFAPAASVSSFFKEQFDAPSRATAADTGSPFAARFVFEIIYDLVVGHFVVGILLATLINGMHVLQRDKLAASNDLSNRCFVCDLTRLQLEQARIDFTQHVLDTHNPVQYLHFLVYLARQRWQGDCSAAEQSVIKAIWCAESEMHKRADWLPRETTLLMEGKLEETLYGSLQSQVGQLLDLVLQSRKERERDREILEALATAVAGREGREGALSTLRLAERGPEENLASPLARNPRYQVSHPS